LITSLPATEIVVRVKKRRIEKKVARARKAPQEEL
jgi:hypothetical protein